MSNSPTGPQDVCPPEHYRTADGYDEEDDDMDYPSDDHLTSLLNLSSMSQHRRGVEMSGNQSDGAIAGSTHHVWEGLSDGIDSFTSDDHDDDDDSGGETSDTLSQHSLPAYDHGLVLRTKEQAQPPPPQPQAHHHQHFQSPQCSSPTHNAGPSRDSREHHINRTTLATCPLQDQHRHQQQQQQPMDETSSAIGLQLKAKQHPSIVSSRDGMSTSSGPSINAQTTSTMSGYPSESSRTSSRASNIAVSEAGSVETSSASRGYAPPDTASQQGEAMEPTRAHAKTPGHTPDTGPRLRGEGGTIQRSITLDSGINSTPHSASHSRRKHDHLPVMDAMGHYHAPSVTTSMHGVSSSMAKPPAGMGKPVVRSDMLIRRQKQHDLVYIKQLSNSSPTTSTPIVSSSQTMFQQHEPHVSIGINEQAVVAASKTTTVIGAGTTLSTTSYSSRPSSADGQIDSTDLLSTQHPHTQNRGDVKEPHDAKHDWKLMEQGEAIPATTTITTTHGHAPPCKTSGSGNPHHTQQQHSGQQPDDGNSSGNANPDTCSTFSQSDLITKDDHELANMSKDQLLNLVKQLRANAQQDDRPTVAPPTHHHQMPRLQSGSAVYQAVPNLALSLQEHRHDPHREHHQAGHSHTQPPITGITGAGQGTQSLHQSDTTPQHHDQHHTDGKMCYYQPKTSSNSTSASGAVPVPLSALTLNNATLPPLSNQSSVMGITEHQRSAPPPFPQTGLSASQIYPGSSKLFFAQRPSSVLVIKKPGPGAQSGAMTKIVDYLLSVGVNVVAERAVVEYEPEFSHLAAIDADNPGRDIDFAITLGGDGTVLHYNSLFSSLTRPIPPVVSFSLGTLGFLTPFAMSAYRDVLNLIIQAHEHHIYSCTRTRLLCKVYRSSGKPSTRQGPSVPTGLDTDKHGIEGQNQAKSFNESNSNLVVNFNNPKSRALFLSSQESKRQAQGGPTTSSSDDGIRHTPLQPNMMTSSATPLPMANSYYPQVDEYDVQSSHHAHVTTGRSADSGTDTELAQHPTSQTPTPTPTPQQHAGRSLLKTVQPLNEVVLQRFQSSMACIQLFIDGHFVTTIRADGVIISTPTGSSGYSMAAGGPMVAPSTPALIITPICPHNLAFRPVVVCDTTLIRLRVSNETDPHTPLVASFDGRNQTELYPGDSIQVTISHIRVPSISFSEFNVDWFESIKQKLFWNASAIG